MVKRFVEPVSSLVLKVQGFCKLSENNISESGAHALSEMSHSLHKL